MIYTIPGPRWGRLLFIEGPVTIEEQLITLDWKMRQDDEHWPNGKGGEMLREVLKVFVDEGLGPALKALEATPVTLDYPKIEDRNG